MKPAKVRATLFAILAAVLYAVNFPFSKKLLENIEPMVMASLLYFGAGLGMLVIYFVSKKKSQTYEPLVKSDFPYVLGMILLDILAPILLMFGLRSTTSSSASLLNNFEIVATTLIAWIVFREFISKRLAMAIALVTLASILLSLEDGGSLKFSWGALLVLGAAVVWGMENNFTRKLSSKNTFLIVILKGIFSGIGSMIVATLNGENLPGFRWILTALLLGFVAYGLSIFFYIKAQSVLGAAKTSAWYAIAPFVGAILSFLILSETLSLKFVIAGSIMIVGFVLLVRDTFHSET